MLRYIMWMLVIAGLGGLIKSFVLTGPGAKTVSNAIARDVQKYNATLPVTAADGYLRLDKAEFVNNSVQYSAVLLQRAELTRDQEYDLKKAMKEAYCHGTAKVFADAKVGIEYTIKTEPHTLDLDIRTWHFAFTPDMCV